jgi:hypothetical protein
MRWNDELTVYAMRAIEHSTWAVINPQDMLRAILKIHEMGGEATTNDLQAIREELGVDNDDFRQNAKHLELIELTESGAWRLSSEPKRPGFYSGKQLADVTSDLGIGSSRPLHIIGHNFLLHAPESLSFCEHLLAPGRPKSFLKSELLNHYVFNQNINAFKFDGLITNLKQFGVIDDCKHGFKVVHSPPALTFFKIASAYFFLTSDNVGSRVASSDLMFEVDSVIPQRDEDYSVLGFRKFPVEGWGKHQSWMQNDAFTNFLALRLIEPVRIARILNQIAKNESGNTRELVVHTLQRLGTALIEDTRSFKVAPLNLHEVIKNFELPKGNV